MRKIIIGVSLVAGIALLAVVISLANQDPLKKCSTLFDDGLATEFAEFMTNFKKEYFNEEEY